MSTQEQRPRIFVGPDNDSRIEAAVRAGGAEPVSDPRLAQAVVWLDKGVHDLMTLLHPGVRWVQLPDAGVDRWLDAGIGAGPWVVTSARGCFGPQVAEHALALLLAGARRLHVSARADSWPAERRCGFSLTGRTVVVVGAGDIGTCLLELLGPLEARTVAVTRQGRAVPAADLSVPFSEFQEALEAADAVVLAAPATPETYHLIGAREFSLMPPGGILVNVGRGSLVDQDALVTALETGHLAYAGLDVTDPEPLPADHPLWRQANVLITPHLANPPDAKRASLAPRVRENTRRFVERANLVSVVDLARGY